MSFHEKHPILYKLMERGEFEVSVVATAITLSLAMLFGTLFAIQYHKISTELKQECIKNAVIEGDTTLLRYETFVEVCGLPEIEYEL